MSGATGWVGGGAALSAAAIWAVSTTLMKGAIVRHGARAMNLFRVSIALFLFWATTLAVDGAGAWRAIATRDGQLLVLSGVIGLAVGDLMLFAALKKLGAQPAIAMNQLSPVWSALLGFALGSEVLHGRELLGIALVIGGVLLVIFGRDTRDTPGTAALGSEAAAAQHSASGRPIALALGIGSSLCNAAAGMMTHHSIASVGALPGSTLRMSGAAVVLLLMSLSGRRGRTDFAPLRALPTMRREIVAVLIATYLGIFLQQQAYAGLDASIALCLLSTTPLFLLPLAVGILHERYRWYAWLGTLIATSGVPLLLLGGSSAPLPESSQVRNAMVIDPHSFARPHEALVRRLELALTVDFATKTLAGRASLQVAVQPGATRLVLDTRDLVISAVRAEQPLKFALAPAQGDFGSALTIELPASSNGARELWIHVDYATSPGAAALQWLGPEQTAGGKSPFLFTQSQAILARTWVPCQDTPSVRMTYGARITVKSPAGGPQLLALMSASNPQATTRDGVYAFDMPQPIPSYLLALAVGDLEFRPLGPRSGVYAEKPVVAKAAAEFVDLESMIAAAEKLYGPYRWGRYDVLVLPPSFPFGGMENPRLTFATPTILAGDRSLVSLIAHELAHSWSGNLVTNATWNDFWLNEGFTVYFEHRIMEAVYGQEFEDALAVLGRQDLEKSIAELMAEGKERDTWLRLDLAGRNPDDGVTEIAYEKGARLLQAIEKAVGRAPFDRFLRAWFDGNAFQSRTTDDFTAFLDAQLFKGQPSLKEAVRVGAWIDGPGLPPNCPRATSSALQKAAAQVDRFASGVAARELDVQSFTTQQWQHFLRQLPAAITNERLAELDAAFGLSSRGNSEVLFAWLAQCVTHRHEAAFGALERFLTSQGRRKFLRPLYQELAKSDWGKELARRIYEKARPGYHAVSRDTIDGLLKWGK